MITAVSAGWRLPAVINAADCSILPDGRQQVQMMIVKRHEVAKRYLQITPGATKRLELLISSHALLSGSKSYSVPEHPYLLSMLISMAYSRMLRPMLCRTSVPHASTT